MAAPAPTPKRPQHDEYKMVGHYKVKASLGEGVNGAVRLGVDVRTGEKVRARGRTVCPVAATASLTRVATARYRRCRCGFARWAVPARACAQVALKFMLRTAMKQRQLDRLDREIRLLTLLYHPNIVELKEVIYMEDEGYVVFAMERCQRGELLKYITDHGYVPEAKFRTMFRAIVSAVDYCHRNSVVHRDLKPGALADASGRAAHGGAGWFRVGSGSSRAPGTHPGAWSVRLRLRCAHRNRKHSAGRPKAGQDHRLWSVEPV